MEKILRLIKRVIKNAIKKITKIIHIYEPLRAAWHGYKQWKYTKELMEASTVPQDPTTLREKRYQKAATEIQQLIENQMDDSERKIVYIFQHSYYSRDGKAYVSGGGERYATDLSWIIYNLNYQPVLIQMGDEDAEKPWVKTHEKSIVIGVNCEPEEYPEILCYLKNGEMHIYSGYVYWGKHLLTPNIIISHGITWDNPASNVNLEILKRILYSAQMLISVDTSTICFLRSAFANDLSQKNIPMLYVPNYTDVSVYCCKSRPQDGRIHITFPRRCAPERGFWLMVQALPAILEKYPNVEFEFIGFVHEQDMNAAIERLKSDFPGRVSQRLVAPNDMPAVYQNTDITLVPTLYSEGTSLSCIEAMACGNAVIATDIGGLPNLIINEFNGLLIPSDTESLYNAICKLIEKPNLLNTIRKNAIEVAQCFSKVRWEKRWENILKEKLLNKCHAEKPVITD